MKDRRSKIICHMTSAHQPGDVRIFLKECRSLANAGYTVHLVAVNCTPQIKDGVQLHSAPFTPGSRLARMTRAARSVYETALALDADIYHFHDPELLPYASKLRSRGKLVIYDAHEDVPRQILGKPWINGVLRSTVAYFFERYENRIARRLSAVVAATPFIRERFSKVNPVAVDVCNYPVTDEIAAIPDWSDREDAVCYVGGITRIRGVAELVDSLAIAQKKLHLAGDYSPVAFREELSSREGWKYVQEWGFVDRAAIAGILASSKCGAVTLYPQVNYLDSLPIKMFEYMLAGIPVIASDFPLWRSIIERYQCGICVDPKDPAAIASGIRTLLGNDEEARKMGERGREAVLRDLNWAAQADKLINLYDSLLGLN